MTELYIGLMSGTSMDGIDAVLVDLSSHQPKLIAQHQHTWPSPLLQRIKSASAGELLTATGFAQLDSALGAEFAKAANQVILKAEISSSDVIAIGSHGQTLAHVPDGEEATSLQLGDPNRISERTKITTVADFRRRDIAAGGQGAPLVPAFHAQVLASKQARVVLNIGGIANITVLPGNKTPAITGFDTGPGNCLMDIWCQKNSQGNYDKAGQWANQGRINPKWLEQILQDDYFTQAPPKSTGTQYFSAKWLNEQLFHTQSPAADIQATLAEFTAITISDAIKRWGNNTEEVVICGGGVHNNHLLERLSFHLPTAPVSSSAKYGLDPDWVEAIAFAWLAKQTIDHRPGNAPSVTGSSGPRILGGIYPK